MEKHTGEFEFPVASAYGGKFIGFAAFPIVEFAQKIYSVGVWSPFTENPIALCCFVQTIEKMIIGGIGNTGIGAKNRILDGFASSGLNTLMPRNNRVLERLKP